MSEGLRQRGLTEQGLKIGKYEFYNIGDVTLSQLKKHKIIPPKDYGSYGSYKPDTLLIDRRNKSNIKVILVQENKDSSRFSNDNDKKKGTQQCNTVAQLLGATVGVVTDGGSYIWINPKQNDPNNEYEDDTGIKRSYTIIKEENDEPLIREFIINQNTSEVDITKVTPKTRQSIELLEIVIGSITERSSQIKKEEKVDPTDLAKRIWQIVWSVSGATPERCLYTFVELFIYKYLSDLDILDEDERGNKINFKHIRTLTKETSFKNYSSNVRPHLKKMFPEDEQDKTTIINGTVLNPDVPEHSAVFYKITRLFEEFGELKNIDPSFKSKVFEEFMKRSISKKNWGRYFTPRNIIDAIVEMSDIDKLEEGSVICDPACGVGGFILEPIKIKENGLNFYFWVDDDKIKSRYKFYGFDVGFEKEEQLTIILAKANMLIFLSELMKKNPTLSTNFSELFNSTFKLLNQTILGTLSITEEDKYDLIMTNPPYITSGSSNYKEAIRHDSRLTQYYRIGSLGIEGLFLQWIIKSVKPGKKAIVIIPDGIFMRTGDNKLREFIKEETTIDGIISLPVNAFYTTPKKTYILILTKKTQKSENERRIVKQTEPVFTFLASEIGESLDVNRFPIDENHLKDAVSLFNQFKGSKNAFKTDSARCKIQPIEKFNPTQHWAIDRWWTKEEKIDLGIEEEETIMTIDEFKEKVRDTESRIHELRKQLEGF